MHVESDKFLIDFRCECGNEWCVPCDGLAACPGCISSRSPAQYLGIKQVENGANESLINNTSLMHQKPHWTIHEKQVKCVCKELWVVMKTRKKLYKKHLIYHLSSLSSLLGPFLHCHWLMSDFSHPNVSSPSTFLDKSQVELIHWYAFPTLVILEDHLVDGGN